MKRNLALLALSLGLAAATADAGPPGGGLTVPPDGVEAFSGMPAGLSAEERREFFVGRTLFRQPWVAAPAVETRESGLGPLYNRISCESCHPKNGRGKAPDGPDEAMHSMLVRLSVPGDGPHGGPNPHPAYGDQLNEHGVPGVPGEGVARIDWGASAVILADGETVSLRAPKIRFADLAYGPLGDDILFSPRVGPEVFGLGLLEAVDDATLLALAAEHRGGTNGRVNWVWDVAKQRPSIGRFGWKANVPTLEQQIAGAFVGDMGLTSPLFPKENCTAVETACQAAPSAGSPELSAERLRAIVFYQRLVPVPDRRKADDARVARGEAVFASSGCGNCHVAELTTGHQTALAQLADQTFHPYTDLLIHDMGEGLADGRPDFQAGGRDWRTPPLWGLGLVGRINEHTTFLHDGRARSLLEAVLWHGGEALPARQAVEALPRADREALVAFLDSI